MGPKQKIDILLTLTPDFKIRRFSHPFTDILGFLEEDLIGKPFSDFTKKSQSNKWVFGQVIEVEVCTKKTNKNYSCCLVPQGEASGKLDELDHRIYLSPSALLNKAPSLTTEPVFKSVFDHAAIGVALVSTEGHILKANDSFQNDMGYSEAELQKMAFPEFTHPEDIDKDVENYTQLLNNEIQDYQMEKRYITKSGESIWVHLSVSLVRNKAKEVKYAVAVVQNIDKNKKHEIMLNDFQKRLNKAFQGAKEAVFHWPDITKDELWWSPNFQSILGYSQEELPSSVSSFFEIIHPKDKKVVEKGLEDHFTIKTPYNVNYRLKTKKGKYKWFKATGTAERDEKGIPFEMVGFVADIDDLKKSENALKNRNRALEKSNNELETFAYVASHDLQEPLRTITSFVQLLQVSLDQNIGEESTSYLNIVEKASLRMRRLIEDLLHYSRIGNKAVENTHINSKALVTDVISDLTSSMKEANSQIEIKNLYPVKGEESKLYRLFKNILANALKFRSTDKQSIVKIDSVSVGKRVRFSITDNGIGIDQEYHESVFEIFKRLHTREEYDGSGIGLAVCRKIVELHQGQILISSPPGGGTCVSFDLPKSIEP